ncbi:diaminopimelate decarboxylase [Alkalilacustris brevis]|uniref:diaminopimelate decarboxylase n=1 Tax=Alkalilacustris brevis TaxID=2026338 RepID=UPI0013902384|nr:diaminopimelate decarboxylase [Alkalilacustris brevis]
MNDAYQGPTITSELGRLPIEAAADRNRMSRGTAGEALEMIDGAPVVELLRDHGSPLFVFSEATLRRKLRRFREAFSSRYKNMSFAWSFKTNRLDAICKIMKDEGWTAEVVSEFEYQKARRLGYAGSEIVYNGPYKSRSSLKTALEEKALIQIDNWDELSVVEELAEELGGTFDVGLRVWVTTGHAPVWSKFGFSMVNGEAQQAGRRIIRNAQFRLHTIHCHVGTFVLDPETYGVATQILLGMRKALSDDTGHLVPCLNLGGGFPSNSLLHGMAGPAEVVIPPIEEYADAIITELNALPKRERPLLRLESGRSLVDEAGYLATTIVAVKGGPRPDAPAETLSSIAVKEQMLLSDTARLSYVLDAGVHLLFTANWFAIQPYPGRRVNSIPVPTRLLGCLCMEIDVIRDHVDLPRLQTGDHLTFHPVGAYNFDQSMQFIHLRPAVVLIGEDRKVHQIRRKETLADIESAETLPDHLSG